MGDAAMWGESRTACTLTYSVDVADGRGGEVVVDDQVDALEVHSSAHEVSADQDPNLQQRSIHCKVQTPPMSQTCHTSQ